MQFTREFDAQVTLGNGALAAGGTDGVTIFAGAEVYSSGSGWKLTGTMAAARELFPAVVLKSGKVLIADGLGASRSVLAGAELYDRVSGLWSAARRAEP